MGQAAAANDMGLRKGSLGYVRFVATGEIPEEFERIYTEGLNGHAFREVDPYTDEDETAGWVRGDDPLMAEFEEHELVLPGAIILLRLRIDTLRVPAALLRAHVDHEVKRILKEQDRAKLTRAERQQVTADVKKDLRRRSLPKMQLVDATWNLGTGEVRVLSTSKKSLGHFVDRFEKSFALVLQPLGQRNTLLLRGVDEQLVDQLCMLDPVLFHLPPNTAGAIPGAESIEEAVR